MDDDTSLPPEEELINRLREIVNDGEPMPFRLGPQHRIGDQDAFGTYDLRQVTSALAASPGFDEAEVQAVVSRMVKEELAANLRRDFDDRIRDIVRQELSALLAAAGKLDPAQEDD